MNYALVFILGSAFTLGIISILKTLRTFSLIRRGEDDEAVENQMNALCYTIVSFSMSVFVMVTRRMLGL